MSYELFPQRDIRVCYWNAEPRFANSSLAQLESHLRALGSVTVVAISDLKDSAMGRCDLLIIAAPPLDGDDFGQWLGGQRQKIHKQGGVWVPVLILAEVGFSELREILSVAAQDNWYFDILSPQHVASVPIRVANLLRIHDHLHEMGRYASAVEDVSQRVAELENELRRLRQESR